MISFYIIIPRKSHSTADAHHNGIAATVVVAQHIAKRCAC